jgi:serine/threonine protein kinase
MGELTHGAIIAGKWVLERQLGRGGMGEVWLATHHTLRQQVAIKILDREAFPIEIAEEARSRFDLEARVAARLARKTRHIVTVIDNGRDGDIDYLVMELLEGESLEERLAGGPLDPSLVLDVVRQASRGLSLAHAEGVIHRDLKPGNLYLTVDDHGERLLKLLDFGIAKASARSEDDGPPSSHATRVGVIIGTAQYMSPEQARGLSIDSRVDVWALAAVAYELLTGHAPHEAETAVDLLMKICTGTPPSPRAYRATLPASLDAVFARAFAPSIDDRFQDTRSFAAALTGALETRMVVPSRAPESVVSYVATPPPMPCLEERRSRGPLFIGGAVLAAIAITGAAFALRRPEPPAAPSSAGAPVETPRPSPSAIPTPSVSASIVTSVARPPVIVKPHVGAPRPTKPLAPKEPTKPAAPKNTDKSEIL